VYREVRRYERERVKNDSTYWFIFELTWRDYFLFLARKFPRSIFSVLGPMHRRFPWTDDRGKFERWQRGETGQGFIDANMREIAATGFMSNRGRQNVASFLARDLQVNWVMGAEYFESMLIDYDPASNYGNWTYTVGVGTDPREHRYFNPDRQAERYDPDGRFQRHWLGAGIEERNSS
jgi:deoxyribodipyrimidine photo-lyase